MVFLILIVIAVVIWRVAVHRQAKGTPTKSAEVGKGDVETPSNKPTEAEVDAWAEEYKNESVVAESNPDLAPEVIDDKTRSYHYKTVEIYIDWRYGGHYEGTLEGLGVKRGDRVSLIQESEKDDVKNISVIWHGKRIGKMKANRLRDMVTQWQEKDYPVFSAVNMLCEHHKMFLEIAFFGFIPLDASRETAAAGTHKAEIEAFNEELTAIPHIDVIRGNPSCSRRDPGDMPDIHITNITRQTNMQKFFPVVVLDTETTGINPKYCRIVELSAIKLGANYTPISCFTTLVNPEQPIPEDAEAVHHISDEMVADAPTFPEIATSFAEFIDGCRIVGHNVKFDLEFLYAAGMEIPPKAKFYDTLDLAKKVLTSSYRRMVYDKEAGGMVEVEDYDVENYRLPTLCDYYGIYRNDAHRSLSDCLATAKILKELVGAKTAEK